MNHHSLNPQTILYQSDPLIERYFLSTIQSQSNGDITTKQQSMNLSELNQYIYGNIFE